MTYQRVTEAERTLVYRWNQESLGNREIAHRLIQLRISAADGGRVGTMRTELGAPAPMLAPVWTTADRANRGGSWGYSASNCRAAGPGRNEPGGRG